MDTASDVSIQNINLFGCSIITTANSSGNTFSGLNAQYVSSFANTQQNLWQQGITSAGSGIILAGDHNTITGCVIDYSAGAGITISGSHNQASNNYVHDCNYVACAAAGIGTGYQTSDNMRINGNTVFDVGLRNIDISSGSAGEHDNRVDHNEVYNGGLLARDFGGIYAAQSVGGSVSGTTDTRTRIDHNIVHDEQYALPGSSDGNDSKGIYLDNGSNNFVVDHNEVSGARVGIMLNSQTGQDNNDILIQNNTVSNTSFNAFRSTGIMANGMVENNLFDGLANIGSSAVVQYNLFTANSSRGGVNHNIYTTDSGALLFNQSAASPYQYQLATGSKAINAGDSNGNSRYLDLVNGVAPDDGAFEYGLPRWSAGSNLP